MCIDASPEILKPLIPKKHKRKLLAALKKMSTMATSRPSPTKRRKTGDTDSDVPSSPPPLVPVSSLPRSVKTNRSPVLVLWASCVAHRLGYSWPESLSLASSLAELFAQVDLVVCLASCFSCFCCCSSSPFSSFSSCYLFLFFVNLQNPTHSFFCIQESSRNLSSMLRTGGGRSFFSLLSLLLLVPSCLMLLPCSITAPPSFFFHNHSNL